MLNTTCAVGIKTPQTATWRIFLPFAAALSSASFLSVSLANPEVAMNALKQGGHVLLMRHAQTVSGVGDPPNFKLGDCSTQRNLNELGRDDAKGLGERLRKAGVKFEAVYTSAWCRCVDTAVLAFQLNAATKPQVLPALNSMFNDRTQMPNRTEELRKFIAGLKPGNNVALVSHMVNISALTNESIGMGEMLVLKPTPQNKDGFQLIGRLQK